jgi:hypothetical protein
MKKLLCIDVRGKQHEWSFNFYGDPKYLDEWRQDGLKIDEVVNVIPEWVVNIGATKLYCFLQNIFGFGMN